MSTYEFKHNQGERQLSYSFTLTDEASPTDVYYEFCHFLTAVYGWDVRDHIDENITT